MAQIAPVPCPAGLGHRHALDDARHGIARCANLLLLDTHPIAGECGAGSLIARGADGGSFLFLRQPIFAGREHDPRMIVAGRNPLRGRAAFEFVGGVAE